MEITVHGKHSPVEKSLSKFATDKMSNLGKFLSTITNIDVELYEEGKQRNGNGHVAHITVSTPGPIFRSKVVSSDPHACIDIALDKLERQIVEFKRKRSGKPAHSRPKVLSTDKSKDETSSEELEDF